MTNTIDMTPSWASAALIYATALRDGTERGQEMAYEEVRRMGELIDELQKQLKEAQAQLAEYQQAVTEFRKGFEEGREADQ